ncbi:MAG: hypothetical protein ACMUIE_05555 [Thermoplasmatota archaeon]
MVSMPSGIERENESGIYLMVKRSPISGSGIARVHTKVLESDDFKEGGPIIVTGSKTRKRVLRLVADNMMEKGKVSLRQKDMDKLGVREGHKVILEPMEKMGNRITRRLLGIKK